MANQCSKTYNYWFYIEEQANFSVPVKPSRAEYVRIPTEYDRMLEEKYKQQQQEEIDKKKTLSRSM